MPFLTSTSAAAIIPAGGVTLKGDLEIGEQSRAVVAFAHGSGSSRLSPRNRQVAGVLRAAGLGTLLFDLLTASEEADDAVDARYRFDIDRLAERLVAATDWLAQQPRTRGRSIGYFGASTGAAAAICAAVERAGIVGAVVSRGGRPDLAGRALEQLRAPTLLIVGGDDEPVVSLNEKAAAKIRAPKRLEIIRGATHLFEEPGALEGVARLARDWFVTHLTPKETS